MAINTNAFTAAFLNLSQRATLRFAGNLDAIRKKKFTFADLMASSVEATIDDPYEFLADVLRNSGIIQSSIFISISLNDSQADSQPPLVVPNPDKAELTDLILLGGSGKERIVSGPNDPEQRVTLVTDANAGTVQVSLYDLQTINPPLQAGQYLGVIYDDNNSLVAHVVVHVGS